MTRALKPGAPLAFTDRAVRLLPSRQPDTGIIVLAPGDTAAGDVTFTPEVA